MSNRIGVGILGASGYTGADLVRLLSQHPQTEIRVITANAHAGKEMAEVFPHLRPLNLPRLEKAEDANWDGVDAVFGALPHGASQDLIATLPERIKVIDLSADFRLRDPDIYAEWYGRSHDAPELLGNAVYGLTEHYREELKTARLAACPGCYPTAALLALIPPLREGAIRAEDIIIDAKSGASGAGRGVKETTLFCEVAEALHPYGIASHRHSPEIEQELGRAAGTALNVTFTPHLVPMNRGELVTCYVKLAEGRTADDLRRVLSGRYADEPFIHVLEAGAVPATRQVRGSNHCVIGVFADRIPGRAIVVGTIDNLVKGSSGQAVQNFNLMFGLEETTALEQLPMFP
ncbi:MAG: N-acetyl-gamma-glutamyl-phosphate reductase [Alphaproteobacteria bacterium]